MARSHPQPVEKTESTPEATSVSKRPGAGGRVPKDRFEALLEAAVDAIIVIDGKGRIQAFSPAAERMFGYGAPEILGKNVRVLMPEPFRSEHDGYIHSYLDSGVPKIIGLGREVEAIQKDGTLFPVDLSVGHARIDGKDAFVGILRDLTERKRITAALSESERAFSTFMGTCPGMAYRCENDEAWTMQFVSSGSLALTGYPPEAFLDGHITYADLIHPEDQKRAQETVEAALANRRTFDLTYRIRTRSGAERWVFERGVGVFTGTDLQVRFLEGVIEDVTDQHTDRIERQRAQQEAESLRETLAHVDRLGTMGEMATGIAHEINQPLAAISNYAQACRFLLEKGSLDPVRFQEILEKISHSAKRASDVISHLRTFVRKRESEREPVEVNALVTDVVALVVADARQRDLEIEVQLAESLPPAAADRVQIQQVILNLVRNGLDAMNEVEAHSNRLLVKTEARTEAEIEIAVSDHGVGVPDGIQEELFQPFYTTKGSGMGMGLSICRSIVDAHGGHLWFTRNPDGGTTFCFTLPTTARAPEA